MREEACHPGAGVVPAPTQGCTLKSPTACSGHVRGQCGILWYGSSGCTNPNQRGSVSSPGAPRVHREEDGVTLGSTRIAFSSLPPPHSTLVRGMPTKYVGNIFATCLKTEFYWKDIIKLHPRHRYPEKGDGPLEIAIWYFTQCFVHRAERMSFKFTSAWTCEVDTVCLRLCHWI